MMKNVLSNFAERQKSFILLIDEVYVKAVNKPSALANTVLGFFHMGLFGGPKFLLRMIRITELDSIFLFDECQKVINSINEAGGNIISIISDDSRVNQKIFKTFDCVLNKPWLTKNGIYLLFDFVHLLKSIRNNWITQKTKELVFPDNGEMKTAKWEDIVTLYKAEESNIVKMANDSICQWVFFSNILFHEIMNSVCCRSLCNALMVISDIYTLNIDRKHGRILSNILLNNYSHMFTLRPSKECKKKVLKLSTEL